MDLSFKHSWEQSENFTFFKSLNTFPFPSLTLRKSKKTPAMEVHVRSEAVDADDATISVGAREIAERYGFVFPFGGLLRNVLRGCGELFAPARY